MRVLVDATYAARGPWSGTGIYIARVADAMSRLPGVEVKTVANRRRRPPAGGGLGSVRNLVEDRWWTSVELPRLARRMRADVIHHPLPARTHRPGAPQVITVHDLAYERLPDQFDRAFRVYAHRAHRSAARAASAVICVSETTAADVQEFWGVARERIVLAHHGPGQPIPGAPGDSAVAEHLLYVGDAEPRKNVPILIAAYARYRKVAAEPLPLVLAGSAGAVGAGVRVVSRPDHEQLGDLYRRAAALIQSSLYEGFGLTALEAMRMGTPVIAAEIPALRETCAAAARYVDPRDPCSLADAMLELASDAGLRAELAERGLRRATGFSWADSARAHVAAYSLALSSR